MLLVLNRFLSLRLHASATLMRNLAALRWAWWGKQALVQEGLVFLTGSVQKRHMLEEQLVVGLVNDK